MLRTHVEALGNVLGPRQISRPTMDGETVLATLTEKVIVNDILGMLTVETLFFFFKKKNEWVGPDGADRQRTSCRFDCCPLSKDFKRGAVTHVPSFNEINGAFTQAVAWFFFS